MSDVFVRGVNTRTGEAIARADGPQGGLVFFCDPRDGARRWFSAESLPIYYDSSHNRYVQLLSDGRPRYYWPNAGGTYAPRPNPRALTLTPSPATQTLTISSVWADPATPNQETWTAYSFESGVEFLMTQKQSPVGEGVDYVLTVQRAASGMVTAIVDSAGANTSFAVASSTSLSITGPDNLPYSYALYPGGYLLQSATYPFGTANFDTIGYTNSGAVDGSAKLATMAWANTNTSTYGYCASGQVASVTDTARGATTGFDGYGAGSGTTNVHLPFGVPDTQYTYAPQPFSSAPSANVLVKVRDSYGVTLTQTWRGDYPVVSQVSDSFGHFVSDAFNASWALQEIDDDFSATPVYKVSQFDATGFAPAAFSAQGRGYSGVLWDSLGRLTSIVNGAFTFTRQYATSGGVTTMTTKVNGAQADTVTIDANGYARGITHSDLTTETINVGNLGQLLGYAGTRGDSFSIGYDGNLLPNAYADSAGARGAIANQSGLPATGTYTGTGGSAALAFGWTPWADSSSRQTTIGGVSNAASVTFGASGVPTGATYNGQSVQGLTNPAAGGSAGVCQ
jgi:hypothetical protein